MRSSAKARQRRCSVADNPYAQFVQNPYAQFVEPSAPASTAWQGSDAGTDLENLLAQYGRGVASLGQGAKQLALHAGGALGLADPKTVSAYDQKVKDEAELYDKDLGQKAGGSVVPAVAQMVTTLPLGGLEALAGKGAFAAAGNTAIQGGLAGAMQPVTDVKQPTKLSDLITGQQQGGEDYLSAKLRDIGLGAGVGAGANLGLRALGTALEAANPQNLASKMLNYFNAKANATPTASEGERLAAETGVDLTPGQISGSKAMNQAENAARQSIFSRDIAFEGDRRRTQQLMDYTNKTLQGISNSDASPITVGNQVRGATNNAIEQLQKWRDQTAAEDFGRVRAMVKDAPIITPQNTQALLQQMADEYGGIGTPSADSIANFAKRQLANAPAAKTSALTDTDRQVMKQLGIEGLEGQQINPLAAQMLEKVSPGFSQRFQASVTDQGGGAPAMGDLNKLMQLRSYLSKVAGGQAKISGDPVDRKIGAQLLGSIDQDINASADQIGGDVGGALKLANARYAESTQQMDSVKASPLGKLLGEDVQGAFQSGNFNTVPPEVVAQRLYDLKPSQLATVKGLLATDQPEAWRAIKAGYLQNAMDKASALPASEGANAPVMRPNVLAKTLGDSAKLDALFEPEERSQIENILATARRLSDKTGYNFSGTAGQNEVLGFLNNPLGGIKKAANDVVGFGLHAGTAGLGAKAVARLMTDADGRAALMKWQSLPAGSAQARQLASYLAATYAAEPEQGQ